MTVHDKNMMSIAKVKKYVQTRHENVGFRHTNLRKFIIIIRKEVRKFLIVIFGILIVICGDPL